MHPDIAATRRFMNTPQVLLDLSSPVPRCHAGP